MNIHCTIKQCTHQHTLHNNATSVHINTLPATQHNPPAHHSLFGQETHSVQQYSQSAHWHGDLYKILSKLCLRLLTTIYCLVPSWQYSSMLTILKHAVIKPFLKISLLLQRTLSTHLLHLVSLTSLMPYAALSLSRCGNSRRMAG